MKQFETKIWSIKDFNAATKTEFNSNITVLLFDINANNIEIDTYGVNLSNIKIYQQGISFFAKLSNKILQIYLTWVPFENRYVFVTTLNGLNLFEIEVFAAENRVYLEHKEIRYTEIFSGLNYSTKINNVYYTVEYIDQNTLKLNGNLINIVECSQYVYKCLKTQIKAIDGANGLYCFIFNELQNKGVFLSQVINFFEKYC